MPLSRRLSQLPNNQLREFMADDGLVRGYVGTDELALTKQRQIGAVENLQTKLQSIHHEFAQVNDYQASGNVKTEINAKLRAVKEKETVYRDLEKKMFQALLKHQLNYKDNGILQNKLVSGISDLQTISNALFESLLDGQEIEELEVQKFIKEYKDRRVKMHLRKEALKRLNEDRIGGTL